MKNVVLKFLNLRFKKLSFYEFLTKNNLQIFVVLKNCIIILISDVL